MTMRAVAAVIALLWAVLTAAPGHAETRVALIIANGDYTAAARLPNAAGDGRVIAASLRRAGFTDVTVIENQTRAGMIRALQAFRDKAANADIAFFHFAGHGIESGGVNYLIPTDAALVRDTDLEFEAVTLDKVLEMTGGARRMRIVVLDACRVAPPAMQRATGSRSIGRGLARIETPADSLVVYSAKAGTIALDGKAGENSPFAAALAKRLPEPGQEVDFLFRLVRDDVIKATEAAQEPFIYSSMSAARIVFVPDTIKVKVTAGLDVESEAWALCSGASSGGPCARYVQTYPQGRFAVLAKARIADFAAAPAAVAVAAPALPKLTPAGFYAEGLKHYEGTLYQKDLAQAARYFEQACAGGVAGARGCSALGVMNLNGEGLAANLSRAAQFFGKGCDGGDLSGCRGLGVLLAAGKGTPKDTARAFELFTKSCSGGLAEGCTNLGDAYLRGDGTKRDPWMAYSRFSSACDSRYAPGCYLAGQLAVTGGHGVAPDYASAWEKLDRGCQLDFAAACSLQGQMREQGLGSGDPNPTAAQNWYRKALNLDPRDELALKAMRRLGAEP